MAINQDPVHHTYMRYVAWSVTFAFLVWFLRSGELIPLMLFIIGIGIIFREETYVRRAMRRRH